MLIRIICSKKELKDEETIRDIFDSGRAFIVAFSGLHYFRI